MLINNIRQCQQSQMFFNSQMFNMKQQTYRRNDPMSILNHLKKLKSKGKTRTPRPTLQVKSSRVQSMATVQLRKQVESISSLSRERDYKDREDSKTSKLKNNQLHIEKSYEKKTEDLRILQQDLLQNRFKNIIHLFQTQTNQSIQDIIKTVEIRVKLFQQYQADRKHKKINDQLDYWLQKLISQVFNFISQQVGAVISHTAYKYQYFLQAIQKLGQDNRNQVKQIFAKHQAKQQIMLNRINLMTQRSIFSNSIITGLSRQQIDIQKWVKKRMLFQQSNEQTLNNQVKSSSMKTQNISERHYYENIQSNELNTKLINQVYGSGNKNNVNYPQKAFKKETNIQKYQNVKHIGKIKENTTIKLAQFQQKQYKAEGNKKYQMVHIQSDDKHLGPMEQSWDKFS